MKTLIVAAGDIDKEDLIKYAKEYNRPKYHCC